MPVIKNARVVRDENQRIIGVVETVTDLSEISRARQEAEEALIRLAEKHRLENLIGKSHEMQKVFAAINAAAARKIRIGKNLSKKELVNLLETSHWNKAEVARRIGVSRTAVWKYMKKWEIPLKPTG